MGEKGWKEVGEGKGKDDCERRYNRGYVAIAIVRGYIAVARGYIEW